MARRKFIFSISPPPPPLCHLRFDKQLGPGLGIAFFLINSRAQLEEWKCVQLNRMRNFSSPPPQIGCLIQLRPAVWALPIVCPLLVVVVSRLCGDGGVLVVFGQATRHSHGNLLGQNQFACLLVVGQSPKSPLVAIGRTWRPTWVRLRYEFTLGFSRKRQYMTRMVVIHQYSLAPIRLASGH